VRKSKREKKTETNKETQIESKTRKNPNMLLLQMNQYGTLQSKINPFFDLVDREEKDFFKTSTMSNEFSMTIGAEEDSFAELPNEIIRS
jgi:hypothetical protein